MSTEKIVGATEVRNHLGQYLHRVYEGEEHIVVEKSGIPVAALISMQEYAAFRRWLAARAHDDLGRKLGAEFERQGITEEKLLELMDEDREAIYKENYGQDTP